MENYSCLQFEEVKELIARKASFSLGQKLIMGMEPSFNRLYVSNTLKTVAQAYRMTVAYGPMPFGGIHDISSYVTLASKDGVLTANELLLIADQSYGIAQIITYVNSASCEKDRIESYIHSLNAYTSNSAKITACIDRSGQVSDNASSKLKNIRVSIKQTQAKIASTMNNFINKNSSYLQDSIIASRNDRNVILVKNAYKNVVKGLQYGTSSSGLATYIEPAEAIEHNNRLADLVQEEKKEVQRILAELSQMIKKDAAGYLANNETLGILDSYFARAIWGRENDCCISTINEDFNMIIEKGRHPLIDRRKVVANSYHMIKPVDTILITGPNTGGKTVSLKLIGLFAVLHQCGVPLPADEVSLPVYDNIFVDIGDNQSIQDDLSTFSAHISKLAYISENATDSSLVILDELGSGTDPIEGQALASAILDTFRERKIYTVATTHFSQLKAYGKQHNEILLASVQFDEENLKPTYKYIENTIGRSNALEIAQRLGFSKYIIKKAYDFKAAQQLPTDVMIENLQKQLDEASQLKEKLKQEKEELNRQMLQMKQERQQLQIDRKEIIEEAKLQAYEIVENVREESDELIAQLKEMDSYRINDVSRIKQNISSLVREEDPVIIEDDESFNIDDYVMISLTRQKGQIISLDKKNAVILCDGMKVKSSLSNLVKIEKPKEKKTVSTKAKVTRVNSDFKVECNLIGMRVEEAMIVLDKYLDNAILANAPFVRIIHGYGTGALRKAVWDRLKKNRYVVKYEAADGANGGSGATIVTLGNKK